MANQAQESAPGGIRGLIADWTSDERTYRMSWGKAMMWMFLLSDVFVFGAFLSAYAAARLAATGAWPVPAEVFAIQVGGADVPLLLIAIMTFILITSSGTMAMAVAMGYRKDRKKAAALIAVTTLLGLVFVGMQALEWTELIHQGYRPWGNPEGASQFGAIFFMITGFHGLHVLIGVIYLAAVAVRTATGVYDRKGSYENVEIAGLYWHFVDLVWVFIFAFFYLF